MHHYNYRLRQGLNQIIFCTWYYTGCPVVCNIQEGLARQCRSGLPHTSEVTSIVYIWLTPRTGYECVQWGGRHSDMTSLFTKKNIHIAFVLVAGRSVKSNTDTSLNSIWYMNLWNFCRNMKCRKHLNHHLWKISTNLIWFFRRMNMNRLKANHTAYKSFMTPQKVNSKMVIDSLFKTISSQKKITDFKKIVCFILYEW